MLKLLITGESGFIANAVLSHLKNSEEIEASAISVRGDDWKNMDFSGYDSILHTADIQPGILGNFLQHKAFPVSQTANRIGQKHILAIAGLRIALLCI